VLFHEDVPKETVPLFVLAPAHGMTPNKEGLQNQEHDA